MQRAGTSRGQRTLPLMHRLFVFGTLKRGFPLHERALAGATWLGRGITVEAYPMFVAGRWFAPMML